MDDQPVRRVTIDGNLPHTQIDSDAVEYTGGRNEGYGFMDTNTVHSWPNWMTGQKMTGKESTQPYARRKKGNTEKE